MKIKKLVLRSVLLCMILAILLGVQAFAMDAQLEEYAPQAQENILITAYLFHATDKEDGTPGIVPEMLEKQLELAKNADCDIINHVYFDHPEDESNETFERFRQLAEAANAKGLKVLAGDYDIWGAANITPELIESYSKLDGIAGYWLTDEPYNPNPYAKWAKMIREIDPDAIIDVNFLPRAAYSEGVYIDQLEDYGRLLYENGCSLSLDAYCFGPEAGSVDEYSLFSNYDDLRLAGLHTNQNTAVYVQSVGMENGYRRPDANTLRYGMMTAVAYGVKNIKFFTWGSPLEGEGPYTDAIIDRNYEPTDLYAPVSEINRKIHVLGAKLAACDALQIYHTGSIIGGTEDYCQNIPADLFLQPEDDGRAIVSLFRSRSGSEEYVMIVNKDFESAQTFTFRTDAALQRVDDVTGALTAVSKQNGAFSVTLQPGDAAVYQIPSGTIRDEQPEEQDNLALNASIWASSSFGAQGMYINKLNDGKTDDGYGIRMSAENEDGEWINVDLGAVETINRIELYPAGKKQGCGLYFPKDFEIGVSADGKTWKTVAKEENFSRSMQYVPVYTFEDTDARYVRIEITGMRSDQAELGEIGIYNDDGSRPSEIRTNWESSEYTPGMNIALGKPVMDVTSSCEWPEYGLSKDNVTDGSESTGWNSDVQQYMDDSDEHTESFTVDLLDEYLINEIRLVPWGESYETLTSYPRDFTISVSMDGTNFTDVLSATDQEGMRTWDAVAYPLDSAAAARYVRFTCTRMTESGNQAVDGWMVALADFEVYGLGLLHPSDAGYAAGSTVTSSPASDDLDKLTDGLLTTEWSAGSFEGADTEVTVTIDLKQRYLVNRIDLTSGLPEGGRNAFPQAYSAAVSTDGEHWTTVFTTNDDSNNTAQQTRYLTFDTTEARYIRITASRLTQRANSSSYGCKYAEVAVYGEGQPAGADKEALRDLVAENEDRTAADYDADTWNLFGAALKRAQSVLAKAAATQDEIDAADAALRKLADWMDAGIGNVAYLKQIDSCSSSYEQEGSTPANEAYINDGNVVSYWASDPAVGEENTPEWIILDLAVDADDETELYDLVEIDILPTEFYDCGNAFPADYIIEVSQNGTDWTQIAARTDDNQNPEEQTLRVIPVDAKGVRYLRFTATKLSRAEDGRSWNVQIAELRAYGRRSGTQTPADRSALQALITKCDAKRQNDYTDASWSDFSDALEAAKQVLNDPDASQAQIDRAVSRLQSALNALVEKSAPAPVTPSKPTAPAGKPSVRPGAAGSSSAELPFIDVTRAAWYRNAVAHVYENRLMTGTSGTMFSPDGTATRAMVLTILYRMAGEPDGGAAVFTDVRSGAWYARAVQWAAEENIANGFADGTFRPDTRITREQLAAILMRYAAWCGCDTTDRASLTSFTDAAQISAYARDALSWAKAAGLMSGKGGGRIDPAGSATRAELAQTLMNLAKLTGEK